MNRKWLAFLLVAAALASRTASAQSTSTTPAPTPVPTAEPAAKYEFYAGFGYTSINQVTHASGLSGLDLSLTRHFGKYFALTGQGGEYSSTISGSNSEYGNPSMNMFLFGPALYAPLSDRLSVFAHGLFGGVQINNVSISPSTAFAGGFGLGMDYQATKRFGVRIAGDDIGSSFTLVPYTAGSGSSTHMQFNAHGTAGIFYKF